MARIAGHLLALLMAWDFYGNARALQESLNRLFDLRHFVLVDANEARNSLCKKWPSTSIRLLLRDNGAWADACTSANKTGTVPRFWRIEARLNYQMLFLSELPITFAIVMKH